MDRPTRLVLHDYGGFYARSGNQITDQDLYKVASTKLAIDGQVKKHSARKTVVAIQEKPDHPDLLLA